VSGAAGSGAPAPAVAPVWYLDTSAATKLVIPEAESAALRTWCDRSRVTGGRFVVSDLVRAELLRTVGRHDQGLLPFAVRTAARFDRLRVTRETFERSAAIEPSALRTLDALHLATALSLGSALAGVVTYDARLAAAADLQGVARTAPGRDR
jgi:predicted nucleic acid-binding protein